MKTKQIAENVYLIQDICNVYIIKQHDKAVAIDFGSGKWLDEIGALGVQTLEHVFLTHHHADQCLGLAGAAHWPFAIHAPAGENKFLQPECLTPTAFSRFGKGCPSSYSVTPKGVAGVKYDMNGFGEFRWGDMLLRFVHTPGHGPNACSVIADAGNQQLAFCGDAAHADATVHQPYHLEWDHWTGSGALAAWEGVLRLSDIHADLLCPSHGPVIDRNARAQLKALADKLMRVYKSKGNISPDEPDLHCLGTQVSEKTSQLLPHLYKLPGNAYMLLSVAKEAFIIDPCGIESLKAELSAHFKGIKITAAAVSHYHFDHCSSANFLKEKHGAKLAMHESVAEPLQDLKNSYIPWLPDTPVLADEVWRGTGSWRWNEYSFDFAHWPGQTWGHCLFQTVVDGKKVAFAGDSFQPASKWNGTGGYCSYNRSRFADGFIPSARLVIDWDPDLVAAGHGMSYLFRRSKFEKVINWATDTERAVSAICPSGDLERDYFEIKSNRRAPDAASGAMFWG